MNDRSNVPFSAYKLGRLIREKKISPVEVITDVLKRINELDSKINSFIYLSENDVLKQAKEAEKEIMSGKWRGPFHGVPYAIKDIFDAKEIPTTAGSKVWKNYIPTDDAFVVKAFKKGGAILVGKLNMYELAFGITSKNEHFGPTANPWDLSTSCGGSSSGSAAALAAGFVPLTIGSDTGGSIRIPSSLTGVVGLKPTYGMISKKGVLPLAWSMDHVGPMALYVEDIAIALTLLSSSNKNLKKGNSNKRNFIGNYQEDLSGIVVGIPTTFFYDDLREDIKNKVMDGIENMESLGAHIEEIEIPGIIEADMAAYTILFSEAAASLEIHIRNDPKNVGEEVKDNVRIGATIPATRYIQAQRVRTKLCELSRKIFSKIDILVVPSTMVDAHPINLKKIFINNQNSVDVRTAMTRYSRYFNLSGNPVLNIPCGLSDNGLPVGMQFVSGYFEEKKLLEVGNAYQKNFPLKPLTPEVR
jgi:aspartyl-tRNA(Asn)/glutamyl-tRNA(Gln) amidotransferase subunit A